MLYITPLRIMKSSCLKSSILLVILLFAQYCSQIEAKKCQSSGKVVGKKLPPEENDWDLFSRQIKSYSTYKCSPPVIYSHTKAFLTFNVFEESGDYPPYCDEKFHPNDARAIALSTGWYDNAGRCLKHINVTANVTQLGVATKIMIMNLLVLTTLCLPQALYGKP